VNTRPLQRQTERIAPCRSAELAHSLGPESDDSIFVGFNTNDCLSTLKNYEIEIDGFASRSSLGG
jgi:hypothetical protein